MFAFKTSLKLWTVAYCSHMRRQMSEQELAELAVFAAEKNIQLAVTGVLLFDDDRFAQVIEGERRIVEELYERIKSDVRHERVTTLTERAIASRAFKGWAMQLITVDFIAPGLRTALIEALDILAYGRDCEAGGSVHPGADICSSALVYGAMITAPSEMGAPGTHVTRRPGH